MNLPLFENTVIWKCSLGPRPEDAYAVQRERLRDALRAMRNGAGVLVGMIASSCRGLTVHDITHLDALWEMADLIAGPSDPTQSCRSLCVWSFHPPSRCGNERGSVSGWY